jgi:hypothetical protein
MLLVSQRASLYSMLITTLLLLFVDLHDPGRARHYSSSVKGNVEVHPNIPLSDFGCDESGAHVRRPRSSWSFQGWNLTYFLISGALPAPLY